MIGASRALGYAMADEFLTGGWDVVGTVRGGTAGRRFDILFVNAGTTNDERTLIGQVSTDDSIHVMVTNALPGPTCSEPSSS